MVSYQTIPITHRPCCAVSCWDNWIFTDLRHLTGGKVHLLLPVTGQDVPINDVQSSKANDKNVKICSPLQRGAMCSSHRPSPSSWVVLKTHWDKDYICLLRLLATLLTFKTFCWQKHAPASLPITAFQIANLVHVVFPAQTEFRGLFLDPHKKAFRAECLIPKIILNRW